MRHAVSVRAFNPDAFWVVGHRGSPTVEVENTLPSCRRAVEQELANGLEVDVCVTRDEEVVLWHDFDPTGLNARLRRWGFEPDVRYRPIAPSGGPWFQRVDALELARFREHFGYAEKRGRGARIDVKIPTLEEFFAWAATQRALGLVFLDVKVPETRMALLPALLRRLGRATTEHRPHFRIVLETAFPRVVHELKRLAPNLDCALDIEPPAGLVCDTAAASSVKAAIQHGLVVAMPQKPRSLTFRPFATHRRIVEADLQRLREHNTRSVDPVEGICAFTINERNEMQALVSLGVAGIQSDRPALLREVVLQLGRPLALVPG